jgi:transposase
MTEAFALILMIISMKTIRQSIGIDVSKDTLVCCIGDLLENGEQLFSKVKSLPNSLEGFQQLQNWVNENGCPDVAFVMEATGVYYENLAYWLVDHGRTVSVQLANKVKHYAKSLNLKTKTDNVDARMISRMGLERKLGAWQMPSKAMREIRFLSREGQEIKAKLVVARNQLHARKHSYGCPSSIEKRLNREIRLLETQLLEIEAELRTAAMADSQLYDKIEKISTIPGVSFMTIITILGETNGFALVSNARQLASFAGLDIQHDQSGNKAGKSHISKKGNSFIRHALYMPALCSTRFNPTMKVFYNGIVDRKPAKKIGVTAVARKLLILIYTLWKNNTEFNQDYYKESRQIKDLPTQDERPMATLLR